MSESSSFLHKEPFLFAAKKGKTTPGAPAEKVKNSLYAMAHMLAQASIPLSFPATVTELLSYAAVNKHILRLIAMARI